MAILVAHSAVLIRVISLRTAMRQTVSGQSGMPSMSTRVNCRMTNFQRTIRIALSELLIIDSIISTQKRRKCNLKLNGLVGLIQLGNHFVLLQRIPLNWYKNIGWNLIEKFGNKMPNTLVYSRKINN